MKVAVPRLVCHLCSRRYMASRCCAVTVKEIGWVAGLVEGEGTIRLARSGVNDRLYPWVDVTMTDRDIVLRLRNLFATNCFYSYSPAKPRKTRFRTMVSGANAIAWLFTIFSFLGERRRKQATKVIKYWKRCNWATQSGEVRNGKFERWRDVRGRWSSRVAADDA